MGATNIFTTIILVQLFFAMAMTGYTYYVPSDALIPLQQHISFAEKTSFEDIKSSAEKNLEAQTNIPIVELGALVFYSGNILLDFILNFAFALPEMVTLFISTIFLLVSVPAQVATLIKIFAGVTISVLYFISIVQLLVGIRSGRLI